MSTKEKRKVWSKAFEYFPHHNVYYYKWQSGNHPIEDGLRKIFLDSSLCILKNVLDINENENSNYLNELA